MTSPRNPVDGGSEVVNGFTDHMFGELVRRFDYTPDELAAFTVPGRFSMAAMA